MPARTALALWLLPLLGFGAVLGLVQSDWRPLRRLDLDVANGLNEVFGPHPAWVRCWRVVSTVGQPGVFQVLAVLTALILARRRRYTCAVWVVATVWLAGLLSNIVKWSVGRPRPMVDEVVARAAGTSFPSGHALSSLVGVAVLLIVWSRGRRLLWTGGATVVLIIGFGRLALGVHYLSDVLAGWLLGASWVLLITALLRAVTSRGWPGPPEFAPGRLRRTRSG